MVYEALGQRGITPTMADPLEIWEVASMLGANRATEDELANPELLDGDGLNWNRRRAIALAQGEPEPQWDDVPPSPDEQAAQMRLMQALG